MSADFSEQATTPETTAEQAATLVTMSEQAPIMLSVPVQTETGDTGLKSGAAPVSAPATLFTTSEREVNLSAFAEHTVTAATVSVQETTLMTISE
jgi:hypothetical protein